MSSGRRRRPPSPPPPHPAPFPTEQRSPHSNPHSTRGLAPPSRAASGASTGLRRGEAERIDGPARREALPERRVVNSSVLPRRVCRWAGGGARWAWLGWAGPGRAGGRVGLAVRRRWRRSCRLPSPGRTGGWRARWRRPSSECVRRPAAG